MQPRAHERMSLPSHETMMLAYMLRSLLCCSNEQDAPPGTGCSGRGRDAADAQHGGEGAEVAQVQTLRQHHRSGSWRSAAAACSAGCCCPADIACKTHLLT